MNYSVYNAQLKMGAPPASGQHVPESYALNTARITVKRPLLT